MIDAAELVLPHGLVDLAQQDFLLGGLARGELLGAGLLGIGRRATCLASGLFWMRLTGRRAV